MSDEFIDHINGEMRKVVVRVKALVDENVRLRAAILALPEWVDQGGYEGDPGGESCLWCGAYLNNGQKRGVHDVECQRQSALGLPLQGSKEIA